MNVLFFSTDGTFGFWRLLGAIQLFNELPVKIQYDREAADLVGFLVAADDCESATVRKDLGEDDFEIARVKEHLRGSDR